MPAAASRSNATVVLAALAAGQFVMALDSSVMNVSIPVVAADVGTDVTGIQTAITMYTLVMAAFMITGGKVGAIIGRKRAFTIGCVVYACGSLTTALSQTLPMLMFGWSLLEGLGAVLILPAIVALVASNFAREERPRAYGLLSAAMAIAVAAGPLIGGICTTYFSWRWVFIGEVIVIAGILAFSKRIADTPPEEGVTIDKVGAALSALGLGLIVYGLLRSGTWGFIEPKPDCPGLARRVAGVLVDARWRVAPVVVHRAGSGGWSIAAGSRSSTRPCSRWCTCASASWPSSSSSCCCSVCSS